MHEAEVALLDEVEKWQTRSLVLLRDRYDQTKVGLHEGAFGFFTAAEIAVEFAALGRGEFIGALERNSCFGALFDGLCQTNFVILSQQRVLTNIGEIQPDEIFFVPLNTFFGHGHPILKLQW